MVFAKIGHGSCYHHWNEIFAGVKGAPQHYVVKLPKTAGARQNCPKIQQVPGTLGTCANSSPAE